MSFSPARWLILSLSCIFLMAASPHPGDPPHLVVSPQGPYRTITAALADAQKGDVIEVRGGYYSGPLVVDKSVSLFGVDWPIIDGGGQGTVVTLNAPGIRLRGFEVRGSGVEPDRDHAGITLTAPGIVVEGNRLVDVLFGIFVARADGAVLRDNDITSKDEYEIGRKGDGIRLWYSQGVSVEGNHVHQARDVVMWYSRDVIVRNNLIESGRYGVHLMYCDGAQIIGNRLRGNSVGIYTMYSNHVELRDNDIRHQRGPSGYALGFKDADFVLAIDNLLADNRAGVFLDHTPFTPQGFARFEDNILAFNDLGVIIMTAVQGASFSNNTFWENEEQVSLQGSGQMGDNSWLGNYWSDYTGFDANHDGVGELPYRSERFFESLMDREPRLRMLNYSPVVQALEFAATSFPIFKPQPRFSDLAPRTLPAELHPSAIPMSSRSQQAAMALLGLGLLLVSGAGVGLLAPVSSFLTQGGRRMKLIPTNSAADISSYGNGSPKRDILPEPEQLPDLASPAAALREEIVRVHALTKRYGQATVLRAISLTAHRGETLALWGANGAGKTTLLKAILGLVVYQGEVTVMGYDARREGKQVRQMVGYVPQEAVHYDMSVEASLVFYARLKKAPLERIPALVQRLGLEEHIRKPVSALSGGLKQRVALAIALLSDPPVLLLDEPTANLDAHARHDYLDLLATLHQESKTILFASHRLEEVEGLADRVVVIESGEISRELSGEEIRRHLIPEVEMSLWIPLEQRDQAVAILAGEGLDPHPNGRGTLVVQVNTRSKLGVLELLRRQGIVVRDFETKARHLWS